MSTCLLSDPILRLEFGVKLVFFYMQLSRDTFLL